MKIPNYVQEKAVHLQGANAGRFTPSWEIFLDQLLTQMQLKLSNDGFIPPVRTTEDIAVIAAAQVGMGQITLVSDSDTSELKAIVDGVVKTVSLT